MKKIPLSIIVLFGFLSVYGCGEDAPSKAQIGGACADADDCDQSSNPLICANHVCIAHCAQTGCPDGKACAESGVCIQQIIDADDRECSKEKPCEAPGKVCSVDYVCVTGECSPHVPCEGGKVCNLVNMCVECMSSFDCDGDNVCASDGTCVECVSDINCASRGMVCDEDTQRCVRDGVERCSAGSCPEGHVCAMDGVCFEGECSPIDVCDGEKFCQNNKCVTRDALVCYEDADCGDGYGCDENHCVAADACSLTRTCDDGQICHEGKCIDKVLGVCDKDHPCEDSTKTCLAGTCVACACEEGKVCTPTGACVDATLAPSKNIRVGDPCVWSKDFAFCDGNRVFSCVKEEDSDTSRVTVQHCGTRACATAPEEGVGCYDTCQPDQNSDFYGVCIDNWGEQLAFTWQCDITKEGVYVWSLQHGYESCVLDCTRGRCGFVPKEFNQSCTTASYPDRCQGNWLTYCYSTSSSAAYGGIMTGTYCFGEQFCALPSDRAIEMDPTLMGNCVDACEEAGVKTHKCMYDEDGNAYSYLYLCAATQDGRLGLFPLDHDYAICTRGCDEETGACL